LESQTPSSLRAWRPPHHAGRSAFVVGHHSRWRILPEWSSADRTDIHPGHVIGPERHMAGRAGNDGGVVAIILHTVSRRWIPDTIFRYTGRAYSFQVLRIRVSGGQSLRAHQLQGIPPSIVIPSVFQKAGRETACRAASRGLSFRASPPLPFRASPSRQGPGPGQAPPPCRPGAAVPTGRSGPATSPDGDRDPRPGRPGGQGRRNPGPAP